MLRASSDARGLNIDITKVATGTGTDTAIGHGAELDALATTLTTNTSTEPVMQRASLVTVAGPAVAERAIGVCATFQMMNRLLDGVGAPVNPSLHPLAAELGFDPAELPR